MNFQERMDALERLKKARAAADEAHVKFLETHLEADQMNYEAAAADLDALTDAVTAHLAELDTLGSTLKTYAAAERSIDRGEE